MFPGEVNLFKSVNPKVTFPDVHEKKPTTATTLFTFGSRKQSGSAHMGYEPKKSTCLKAVVGRHGSSPKKSELEG